ncbi:MAG: ADP-ribosylation factor-like protein [Candidatus Hodarchaeota archaeon]
MSLKVPDYKVFVAGPVQAGKTTFIHTLDPYATSVERPLKDLYRGEKSTTTIGFDLGSIIWVRKTEDSVGLVVPKKDFKNERTEYEGWIAKEIVLRGAPGQLHFINVRGTFMRNADGVLFIIDSADPGKIGAAMSILAEVKITLKDIPIEIIANKQDLSDAASPREVAQWIGVEKCFGMSAKDCESCRDAVGTLLLKINALYIGTTKNIPPTISNLKISGVEKK